MGVCTKERKGVAAEVLMAIPCTNSLGGESGGHKHEGCGGRRLCWMLRETLVCIKRTAKEVFKTERKVGFIENTAMRHRRGG